MFGPKGVNCAGGKRGEIPEVSGVQFILHLLQRPKVLPLLVCGRIKAVRDRCFIMLDRSMRPPAGGTSLVLQIKI